MKKKFTIHLNNEIFSSECNSTEEVGLFLSSVQDYLDNLDSDVEINVALEHLMEIKKTFKMCFDNDLVTTDLIDCDVVATFNFFVYRELDSFITNELDDSIIVDIMSIANCSDTNNREENESVIRNCFYNNTELLVKYFILF